MEFIYHVERKNDIYPLVGRDSDSVSGGECGEMSW